MKHVLAGIVLLLAIAVGVPVEAAAPEKFQKECVKSLAKSQRQRPRSEHEAFCRCVTETGQRLGLTRSEFAIERERLNRDPEGAASGRIRQISNLCHDNMVRVTPERSGF
jgi:hypothetical protein